jgi:hypothetical protein
MELPEDIRLTRYEDSLALDALLARLEGVVGRTIAEEVQRALNQAQFDLAWQVNINGDGNIVGHNNTVELRKEVQQQVQQAAPAIIPQTRRLPPSVRVLLSGAADVEAERQVVSQALDRFHLETVRVEAFSSQSVSPAEVGHLVSEQCDIYVAIYGGAYGDPVPGDGRSVTEIEYQTAHGLDIPCLIYRKRGISVEPEQEKFLQYVETSLSGQRWRDFGADDVPDLLVDWIQQDVKAVIGQHPEWEDRPPRQERVLLASVGLSPGAVTGLYYALARAGKPVSQVRTFSSTDQDVRDAVGICEKEFQRLGVNYGNRFFDAEDIASDADAQAFKSTFYGLLQEALEDDAEIVVGITGGRTVMGALMAIVAQTTAPDRVLLYHLDVEDDIEADGRLPQLWHFQYTDRWRELLAPPREKCRLVQVPYVRFPAHS